MYSNFGGFDSFDRTFNMVSSMSMLIFAVVFVLIIITIGKQIMEWNKNNHSPRLTVYAKVVTKRTNVTTHHNTVNNMPNTTHSTTYYVTFEFDSGDRLEFNMSGNEYSMLVEGDYGELTFQGTRYLGFNRHF